MVSRTPIIATRFDAVAPHISQKERVLAILRFKPDGVCLAEVERDLSYTLRNRVSELRADEVPIIGERCTKHSHRGPILRYRLATKPAQLALL
jgi:hypothetical protein